MSDFDKDEQIKNMHITIAALEEKLGVAVKLIEDEVDCEYNGTYRLGNQNLQNFPAHDKENCRKCQTLTKIKGA